MRYIRTLTPDEISALEFGYKYGKKHYFRVKCKGILMSHAGKNVSEIAAYAGKTPRTVRNWFDGFERGGLEKLVVQKGRGAKAKLDHITDEQVKTVKEEVKKNYQNLKAVCANLTQKLGFEVTKPMLKRSLKKNLGTPGAGSART